MTTYTLPIHTSLYSASGDEDWQPLASWETECRCTDVPTHTHIRHKYTQQAGCHSWPVDFVSMDQLQGESFWHSDRQDRGPRGLQALSSCLRFPVSLSASGCVVFLPQQKFSMQCPNMARWLCSQPQNSHASPMWDELLLQLTKNTKPPRVPSFIS